METRQCRRCKEVKSLEAFYMNGGTRRGRRHTCKECHIITNIIRQRDNPSDFRWRNIRQIYGISKVRWNRIFDQQGRVCAICSSDDPKSKRGWHTDHDKQTGIIRGILCYPCNLGLGQYEKLKRNPKTEEYLARSGGINAFTK